LFQARRIIEPAGIDALAQESSSTDRSDDARQRIEQLVSIFDDYEGPIARADYGEYFDADHHFHSLIVAALRNGRMDSMYQQMSNHINRGRHFLTYNIDGRADATLTEHKAVVDALRDERFDEAREALIYHLTVGEQLMLTELERMQEAT